MEAWILGIALIVLKIVTQGEAQKYLQTRPMKYDNLYGARRDGRQDSYQLMDYPTLMRLFQESFGLHGKQETPSRKTGSSYSTIDDGNSYSDYETSHSVNLVGPSQLETIQTEHYHKKVPAFDVSDFQHDHHEKHAEVHYHQHKHVHKHDHKQEHVHKHKNDHQHKHLHHQNHKHGHHEDHKHGHDHKHDHHQNHKHDHHHQHKHGHHQDHKHDHHHGHKHQHNEHAKHHHGHKHGHDY